MQYSLGIDPGKDGGLAIIKQNGTLLEAHRMPKTARELFLLIESISETLKDTHAYVEDVKANAFTLSSYCLGYSRGQLEMALVANKIPYQFVSANTWQRALKCQTRSDKSVTRETAELMYPGVIITNKTADAILIAEYGRLNTLGVL